MCPARFFLFLALPLRPFPASFLLNKTSEYFDKQGCSFRHIQATLTLNTCTLRLRQQGSSLLLLPQQTDSWTSLQRPFYLVVIAYSFFSSTVIVVDMPPIPRAQTMSSQQSHLHAIQMRVTPTAVSRSPTGFSRSLLSRPASPLESKES